MNVNRNTQMHVLFSSDDGYAPHLGAAIYSLLEHNRCFESITIYIINNHISQNNEQKLQSILQQFSNAKIDWIPFDDWKDQLKLNMAWDISISAYARLFAGSMVPLSVDRVLYLDCDMIVCDSLMSLWNWDLSGKALGAVQDTVNDGIKKVVGLKPEEAYFNSGMLLIDLKKWREDHFEEKCLNFIEQYGGQVIHHDQGVLNGVLKNNWECLPVIYNLMTLHYLMDEKKIRKYYQDHASFYSANEINLAEKNPVILHFTPSFTSRPWVKDCKHPLKKLYWNALEHTPWRDMAPQKNGAKWYVKLIEWRYRKFPF